MPGEGGKGLLEDRLRRQDLRAAGEQRAFVIDGAGDGFCHRFGSFGGAPWGASFPSFMMRPVVGHGVSHHHAHTQS
jgi:hypothetical protein